MYTQSVKITLSICVSVFSDNEDPVFTSPLPDLSQPTDTGRATATVTWTQPSVTDNSNSYTLTSSHRPGDSFPIGSTSVTYTATDPSDNMATISFTITVTGNYI